jgi:hypothetical protein
MEGNDNPVYDEKITLINNSIGVILLLVGIYCLFYAYKTYKKKDNFNK